jgi:hypothetical protein
MGKGISLRTFRINRQLSEEVRVTSGMPQGSVLRPLLFLAPSLMLVILGGTLSLI